MTGKEIIAALPFLQSTVTRWRHRAVPNKTETLTRGCFHCAQAPNKPQNEGGLKKVSFLFEPRKKAEDYDFFSFLL